ncbi:hypothetical protein BDZ90DRAFT_186961 [Jaminaea rosea]|uniref:Uncharacterized protein n=1 Tax=Jaminaea rosea TaxID=1569628 RepID=A0A316UTB2_9BASI|nr:hypothetical protein BDZ90DRAFT_186961 [Jaminaea rosea]PWN27143.1 hypothetical protein BDZ90DRAFT_186961 [Jaminaea rosea]
MSCAQRRRCRRLGGNQHCTIPKIFHRSVGLEREGCATCVALSWLVFERTVRNRYPSRELATPRKQTWLVPLTTSLRLTRRR